MNENDISRIVVDAAIEVHRTLGGPGLLESIYEEALVWELTHRGLHVDRQKQVPVIYKGVPLETIYRTDMIVESQVVVECKATTNYNEIYEVQTLTYLKITGLKLGLVINFGERLVKNGIHRVINGIIQQGTL